MILTAKEMKELTLPPYIRKLEKEKLRIYNKIARAARRGHFSITYNKVISEENERYFKTLGYKVIIDKVTRITWKENENA